MSPVCGTRGSRMGDWAVGDFAGGGGPIIMLTDPGWTMKHT